MDGHLFPPDPACRSRNRCIRLCRILRRNALFRFLGDWIISKLGAQLALRAASLTAAAGLFSALCMHSAMWAYPGFAAAGAGFSIIIPIVYGGGGRITGISSGAGIATITGIGYIGFIVGPPTIGFLSQLVTLRYALLLVVACCVTAAVLSGFLRGIRGPEITPAQLASGRHTNA